MQGKGETVQYSKKTIMKSSFPYLLLNYTDIYIPWEVLSNSTWQKENITILNSNLL